MESKLPRTVQFFFFFVNKNIVRIKRQTFSDLPSFTKRTNQFESADNSYLI